MVLMAAVSALTFWGVYPQRATNSSKATFTLGSGRLLGLRSFGVLAFAPAFASATLEGIYIWLGTVRLGTVTPLRDGDVTRSVTVTLLLWGFVADWRSRNRLCLSALDSRRSISRPM